MTDTINFLLFIDLHILKALITLSVPELQNTILLKLGKKILDVGCGGGFFLASLNNSWDKYGTEINPVAAKFAKEKFRVNVFQGKLKTSVFINYAFFPLNILFFNFFLPFQSSA